MANKPTYRDQLAATQARADSLEAQLSAAEARIGEFENPSASKGSTKTATDTRASAAAPLVPVDSPKKRIIYQHPNYALLLQLWLDGIRTAANRIPKVPDPKFSSVIAHYLFRLIGVPLFHLFRVLYVLHLFLLVAPWTLLLSLLLSLLLLPIAILGSFEFANNPSPSRSASAVGRGSGYLWTLLTFAGQPLLPLFAPGWNGE